MTWVSNSLTKKKTKSTRIIAVALAVAIATLSIDIRPAQSAAIPAAVGAGEMLFGAIAVGGGAVVASQLDLKNMYTDMSVRHPDYVSAWDELALIQNVHIMDEGGVNHKAMTMRDAIAQNAIEGKETIIEIGINEVSQLAESIGEGLKDYFYPDVAAEEGQQVLTGSLSNATVAGVYDGNIVYDGNTADIDMLKIPNGEEVVLRGKTINIVRNMQIYDYGTRPVHYVYLSTALNVPYGWKDYKAPRAKLYVTTTNEYIYTNLVTERENQIVKISIERLRINGENEITKINSPYTATVSNPTNIITNRPAAVAHIANLGGVAVDSDDRVGLRIPSDADGSLVNKTSQDVVTRLDNIIYLPGVTPPPGDGPNPTPPPNPPSVMIPPIFGGVLDSLGDKLSGLKNDLNNLPEPNTEAEGKISSLEDKIADLQQQLGNIPEDGATPNEVADISNGIDEIQKLIDELNQIINASPEEFPDTGLKDELNDLFNQLQEIQNLIDGNGENEPGTTPSGLMAILQKILSVLEDIKQGVLTLPETISAAPAAIGSAIQAIPEAVIGDMQIEQNDDDIDNDLDWSMIFPFCIPFDITRMFQSLVSSSAPPRFETEIMGYTWVLDFAEYTYIASAIRWALWVSFAIWLMVMTGRVIKWH